MQRVKLRATYPKGQLPDIEKRLIALLHAGHHKELLMPEEQIGAGLPTLEDPTQVLLDHLTVVVGHHVFGGVGNELHHANPHVGVVKRKVVRHAPHDHQVNTLLLQLPGYDAAGSGEAGLRVIYGYHHFTVGGEHLSFMKPCKKKEIFLLHMIGTTWESPNNWIF